MAYYCIRSKILTSEKKICSSENTTYVLKCTVVRNFGFKFAEL